MIEQEDSYVVESLTVLSKHKLQNPHIKFFMVMTETQDGKGTMLNYCIARNILREQTFTDLVVF